MSYTKGVIILLNMLVLSICRFSSVTERFFMELNTRRIDTSGARGETLSIINGMRYLKLGVRKPGHFGSLLFREDVCNNDSSSG